MRISIITRNNAGQWGGDLTVINQLVDGMSALGVETIKESGKIILEKDKIFFITNTCLDQSILFEQLISNRIGYYCLPFHEDFRKYYTSAMGMVKIAKQLLEENSDSKNAISVEEVENFPEITNYSNAICPQNGLANRHGLEKALMNFPSSKQEADTILRDSPRSKVKIAKYPTDISDRFLSTTKTELFSEEYNIPANYLLQVGRLEPRKNQLATILATRSIPLPLVFIASSGYSKEYNDLVIKAILKYRKYPTFIISQDLPEASTKILKIIKMREGKKLDWTVLQSAYLGCIVNIHPAFYELPGLTYLESIKLQRKTIISKNASIKDYLIEDKINSGIYFVDPSNIQEIKNATLQAIYGSDKFFAEVEHITSESYAKNILSEVLSINS